MPSETRAEPTRARSLSQIVSSLAGLIERGLSPGDVSALRRLTPDDLATPAFWKLAGAVLTEELRGDGPGLESRERAWAVIIGVLAVTSGLHAPGRPLGTALAGAGLSELRLTRLLRAHDAALPAEVRSVSAYLASKAEPFDGADLARLVLSDGGPSEESVRRSIARSYFGQLSRNDK